MKIYRFTDPNISYVLLPWFMEDETDRFTIGAELEQRLTGNPEETLVLVAEDDNGNIEGMAVAYCRYSDVLIWQARFRPGYRYTPAIMGIIIAWAKSRGYSRLMAYTKRARALARKWKFRINGKDDGLTQIVKEI